MKVKKDIWLWSSIWSITLGNYGLPLKWTSLREELMLSCIDTSKLFGRKIQKSEPWKSYCSLLKSIKKQGSKSSSLDVNGSADCSPAGSNHFPEWKGRDSFNQALKFKKRINWLRTASELWGIMLLSGFKGSWSFLGLGRELVWLLKLIACWPCIIILDLAFNRRIFSTKKLSFWLKIGWCSPFCIGSKKSFLKDKMPKLINISCTESPEG